MPISASRLARSIDLVEGTGEDFADFVAWVARKAAEDFECGHPPPSPLGKSLCEERLEGWRIMHKRLASTVYNQTRHSLKVLAKEQAS